MSSPQRDSSRAFNDFTRAANFEEYCGDECVFMMWLSEVDILLEAKIGLGVFDIADKMWRDEYDSGSTPEEGLANQVEISHDLF